jgi:hypothetical protein
MMLQRDLRLSAVHESCHAVVFLQLGIKVRRIWLTNSGGGYTGIRCDEEQLASFERLTAIVAAEVGEEILCHHRETRTTRDRLKAKEIARKIDPRAPEAVVEEAVATAHGIVARNRSQIMRVAEKLLETGELSGAEIVRIARLRENAACCA